MDCEEDPQDSKEHLKELVIEFEASSDHLNGLVKELQESKDLPDSEEDSKEGLRVLEDQGIPDAELLEDPLAPSLRNQRLDTQARIMLLNVYKYMYRFRLAQAKERGVDMNVVGAVVQATGVSRTTVHKMLSQIRKEGLEKTLNPPKKTRKRKVTVRTVDVTDLKKQKK